MEPNFVSTKSLDNSINICATKQDSTQLSFRNIAVCLQQNLSQQSLQNNQNLIKSYGVPFPTITWFAMLDENFGRKQRGTMRLMVFRLELQIFAFRNNQNALI